MKRIATLSGFAACMLAGSAFAQLADTEAGRVPPQFYCNVGIGDDPTDETAEKTASVDLYRSDISGPAVACGDILSGTTSARLHFTFTFPGNTIPEMRSRAYSEPGCTGMVSAPSENKCLVKRGPPARPVIQ